MSHTQSKLEELEGIFPNTDRGFIRDVIHGMSDSDVQAIATVLLEMQEPAPKRRRRSHVKLLFSGGGYRSLQSSAVFVQALKDMRLDLSLFTSMYGVSGGSWFLLALRHGFLRAMLTRADYKLDNLLSDMKRAEVLKEITHDLKHAVGQALLDKVFVILDEILQPEESFEAARLVIGGISVACLLNSISHPESPDPLTVLIREIAATLVPSFGSSLLAALHENPITTWTEQLRSSLFGGHEPVNVTADVTNTSPDIPQLFVTSIVHLPSSPEDVPRYDWIATGIAELRESILHCGCCKFKTRVRHNSPIDGARLAAYCGSAFAFDKGTIIEKVGDKIFGAEGDGLAMSLRNLFVGKPLLANVTQTESVVTTDGRALDLEMRDAGLDVNVSFVLLDEDTDIAWVVDSGVSSQLGQQLEKATLAGHLGHYGLFKFGGNRAWGVYKRDKGCSTGPRVIMYFMGLTDVHTMEVADVGSREADLAELHKTLLTDIPMAMTALAEACDSYSEYE